MKPFKFLNAIAAPLDLINVDTDMIIPKQCLKTIKRTGLGKSLFLELRYHEDGTPRADFVLNQAPWDRAEILIANDNFGCGSSREHAPWALLDFGIRCIIAPSYADIFYNNCFKNGILPIVLDQAQVDKLRELCALGANGRFTIDLEHQQIVAPDGREIEFAIDPFRKECLMQGYDDIALTLQHEDAIGAFEARHLAKSPWLGGTAG